MLADSLIAATDDPLKVCESSMYMIKTKYVNEMESSGKNVNNDPNYFQNCLCIQALLLLYAF